MATSSVATAAYAASQNFLAADAGGGLSAASASGASGGFEALLKGALSRMTDAGHAAETQVQAAATGRADLVDVVTAVAETETALQTLVAVRDRMISAYEEIMRMQI